MEHHRPARPLAIALLVEVPWDQTNRRLEWRLELVDSDGYPVLTPDGEGGESPIMMGGEFEVGRPPGTPHGAPIGLPLGLNLSPLPLAPTAATSGASRSTASRARTGAWPSARAEPGSEFRRITQRRGRNLRQLAVYGTRTRPYARPVSEEKSSTSPSSAAGRRGWPLPWPPAGQGRRWS